MYRILSLFFILCFFSTQGISQKSFELGPFVGRSYYLGELNPKTHVGNGVGNLSFGGILRYNLNKRYSLKASIIRTKLSAEDIETEFPFNQQRNAAFESNLTDLSANIEFNFLPYAIGDKKHFFSPYLFTGFSYFFYNPTTTINGVEVPDESDGRRSSLALAFGPGIKVNLGRKISFAIEWGFRKTFIDDLDGLPNTTEDLLEQGKEYDNDWYVLSGIMLTYKITNTGPCPMQNF